MWQTAPLNRDLNGESKYKFPDPAHVITGQTRFAKISLKTTGIPAKPGKTFKLNLKGMQGQKNIIATVARSLTSGRLRKI